MLRFMLRWRPWAANAVHSFVSPISKLFSCLSNYYCYGHSICICLCLILCYDFESYIVFCILVWSPCDPYVFMFTYLSILCFCVGFSYFSKVKFQVCPQYNKGSLGSANKKIAWTWK